MGKPNTKKNMAKIISVASTIPRFLTGRIAYAEKIGFMNSR
jgi:hypothetical protein